MDGGSCIVLTDELDVGTAATVHVAKLSKTQDGDLQLSRELKLPGPLVSCSYMQHPFGGAGTCA
jgi:hypothetical protein